MTITPSQKREREGDDESQPKKKKKMIRIEQNLLDAVSELQEHVRLAHNIVTDLQKRTVRTEESGTEDVQVTNYLTGLHFYLILLETSCAAIQSTDHQPDANVLNELEPVVADTPPASIWTLSDMSRHVLQCLINRINKTRNLVSELYTPLVETLVYPPSASDYANPTVWPHWQKQPTAILNLRPSRNQGLPLSTLHPIFSEFRAFMASPPPKTDDLSLAYTAAHNFCLRMADSFEKPTDRQSEFSSHMKQFLGREVMITHDVTIDPGCDERNASVANLWIQWKLNIVALGAYKHEMGEGDGYMQVSRIYQSWVNRQRYLDPESGFLADGAPLVLICVMGPLLIIAGGFFDGKSTLVEPLAQPYLMLPDHNGERLDTLAHILLVTKQTLERIAHLCYQAQPTTAPPATPRVYPKFNGFDGTVYDLKFTSRVVGRYPDANPLFLATMTPSSSTTQPEHQVFVKLIAGGQYGFAAHQKMAEAGYSPALHGVVAVKGAPTAYIMEYLSPDQGWKSVHDYIVRSKRGLELSEFNDLLRVMEGANIVHGDLRPNNIMMRKKDDRFELQVIDFDRSGSSGEVEYPPLRNENIPWPDKVGSPIVIGHDRTLLQKSLNELLSKVR